MDVTPVTYDIDRSPFEGAFVHDASAGRQPAVLLAPDWMGVSDQAIASAERVASFGYAVFVADMYGAGRRPADPSQAGSFAEPLKQDPATMRRRIDAARRTLLAEGERRNLVVDAPAAAIGFCFGGLNVLELCRTGAELAAVVSLHGDLLTRQPAAAGTIKAPVLVLHGSADPVAPEAQRQAFEAEMQAAGARWSMMVFGGAVHSFTDPGANIPGVAMFEAAADRWSFRMLQDFLKESFGSA